jgi:hypothetical protein
VNISDNLLNVNFNSKIKQGSDDFDFSYSNKLGVTYKESFLDETLDVSVNATFNSITGATDGKGNNLANTWLVPSQQKYQISYQPELSIWKVGGSFTSTVISGKPGKPDQDSGTVGVTIGNGDLGINVGGNYTHTTIGDKGYDSWGGSLVYDTGVAKFSFTGSLKEGPKVNGLEGSFKVEIPWGGLQ